MIDQAVLYTRQRWNDELRVEAHALKSNAVVHHFLTHSKPPNLQEVLTETEDEFAFLVESGVAKTALLCRRVLEFYGLNSKSTETVNLCAGERFGFREIRELNQVHTLSLWELVAQLIHLEDISFQQPSFSTLFGGIWFRSSRPGAANTSKTDAEGGIPLKFLPIDEYVDMITRIQPSATPTR